LIGVFSYSMRLKLADKTVGTRRRIAERLVV
jgi:hypothetical protein